MKSIARLTPSCSPSRPAPGSRPMHRPRCAAEGALVAPKVAKLLACPGAREHIKPEALWEHDQAQGLSAMDFMQASARRPAFHGQLLELLGRYDLLALPVTQVWPFPVDERWPRSVAGREIDSYHRWMDVTIYASFAGLPALSLPAGFHANGRWPTGLQLIGRPQGEAALLGIAAAYEMLAAELLARRPPEPGDGGS